MEPKLGKFAQKLASFLQNKYFYIVGEGESVHLLNEGIGHFSSGYTEDIGIAVYMLSYTGRLEYKRRIRKIKRKFKNDINFAAYALKFSQTYFKKPSIFKVLMICSCISELSVYFSTGPGTVSALVMQQKYNFYLSNCLIYILRIVCFDYLFTNGGWKALDAEAKKISAGYETLRTVVDAESPFHVVPIEIALQNAINSRDVKLIKSSKKVKDEQCKNSEVVCSLESGQQALSGEQKLICLEDESKLTCDSKCDESVDTSCGAIECNLPEFSEEFSYSESPVTESSNVQLGETMFDKNQLQLTKNSKCNESIDMTFGSIDDIDDDIAEFFFDNIGDNLPELYISDTELPITDTLNIQHLNITMPDENQLELTENSKYGKSIDMTFGAIDDISDPVFEFYEEGISYAGELSTTDSSNVQHLSETIDTKQTAVSENFRCPKDLEKEGSCKKQDTAESHEKLKETAPSGVSKSRKKKRRRNRKANRPNDPVSDSSASTQHQYDRTEKETVPSQKSNYDLTKKSTKPDDIEKIEEYWKPPLTDCNIELENREDFLDACGSLIHVVTLPSCECCPEHHNSAACSTQQQLDRPEEKTIHSRNWRKKSRRKQ